MPDRAGLGVGIDLDAIDAIEAVHQLYLSKGLGVRNDAIAMPCFFPGWKYDNKRPSIDR